MPIEVGDRIIHPRHGLGQVTNLTVKQFVDGEKRPFYEISFPNSTLWVPLSSVSSGIRKLTGKNEVVSCRRVLRSPAEPLEDDYRLRQTKLKKHLQEGMTVRGKITSIKDFGAFVDVEKQGVNPVFSNSDTPQG